MARRRRCERDCDTGVGAVRVFLQPMGKRQWDCLRDCLVRWMQAEPDAPHSEWQKELQVLGVGRWDAEAMIESAEQVKGGEA